MDNCDLPCSDPMFEICFCCEARDTCPVGKFERDRIPLHEAGDQSEQKKLWENVSLDTIQ